MANAHELAVPHSRALAVRNLPAGSRAHVHVAGGDCAAHMVYAGFNRKTGTATYALRFVNQTPSSMSARMFCVTRRGEAIPAYPLAIDIAPFSIKDSVVPVRIADIGPYDRALVEVEGGGVAFSVDAPAPPPQRSAAARLGRWGMAAAIATIALALGAAAATPRLPVLAAPSRALAGQRIDVPYVREGLGSLQYDLSTPDGRQISAGMSAERQGILHVLLPKAAVSTRYVLHAHARGPLGSFDRSASVVAVAPPPAARSTAVVAAAANPAVVIGSLSVSPSPVRIGTPLKVAYVTNAVAGDVWLIDSDGRNWSHGLLQPRGVTWLHVPAETAGREMRVVLHARGSHGDATSAVGVMIFSSSGESTAVPFAAAGTASTPGSARITLSKETVPSGYLFTVRTSGSSGAVRVALTDGGGKIVAQGESAAGGVVTMTAPHVRSTATYYVIATITQGSGEQSLVRKLVVVPHSSRP